MASRNHGREPTQEDVYPNSPQTHEGLRPDRKTQQLCKQVERTLNAVLPECREAKLRALVVVEVRALAGASRLEVVLVAPSARDEEVVGIAASLGRARSYLRSEVAQAIHRKRVPELAFAVLAGGAP